MLVKPSYYGQYKITQGIVIFRFDDMDPSGRADLAMPILNRYGIAGTFFTNTRRLIDLYGQFGIDKMKALITGGHEVASHFGYHYSLNKHTDPYDPVNESKVGNPMTETQLREVLQMAVDDIHSWGGTRNGKVESVTTPWQEWNFLAQTVIPQYHTNASHQSTGPMSYPPTNYFDCRSFVVENTMSVQTLKNIILDCFNNRKFVQLMFHTTEHNDGTKTQGSGLYNWLDTQLEELCAWCATLDQNKIIFPQMRDATRYMKGLGDYNYTVTNLTVGTVPALNIDETHQLDCHAYNSSGEEIYVPSVATFTSSNEAIVTVDNTGLITRVGVGTATITISADSISEEIGIGAVDDFYTSGAPVLLGGSLLGLVTLPVTEKITLPGKKKKKRFNHGFNRGFNEGVA